MTIDPPTPPEADACPMPARASSAHASSIPTATDDDKVNLLSKVRTVAVVGASPNPDRTSHKVAVWLMENTPWEFYLVNPMAGNEEVNGHGFYGSLEELPVVPDLVDVFRASEHVGPVADSAIAIDAVGLWLQLGVVNDDAAARAYEAGMMVVQDSCLKIEYDRLREQIEADAPHHG